MTDGTSLTYHEVCAQPYDNMTISAGMVDGHPVDTLYLRINREDAPLLLVLRPDEAAAIAFVLAGALWNKELSEHLEAKHAQS